jgi:hypothetical protein
MGMREFTKKYFEKRLEVIRERKKLLVAEYKFEEAALEREKEKEIMEIMNQDPLDE